MNKLFVDTNVFESMGFNFDIKNPIIAVMLKNAKDKEFEYYSLSVIDGEVLAHLNDRGLKEYNYLKKVKWLKKFLSDQEIKDNCYKDLIDYQQFKDNIAAIHCDLSKINPEKIFKKYFNLEYPFEKADKKRYEFPDAFIAEFINGVPIKDDEKIYVVTNDQGLKLSLNSNIYVYDSLELFLADINNIKPKKYKAIEKFILTNTELIQNKMYDNKNVKYNDLEDEEIDVDDIKIQNIIDIKVIGSKDDTYYVSCKCDVLKLQGCFSCLDYYNSYAPNDCDFYAIQEYIKAEELIINNYEFIIEIVDSDNDNYLIKFQDEYDIEIDYKLIAVADCERYNYDGEDSFTQDNDRR